MSKAIRLLSILLGMSLLTIAGIYQLDRIELKEDTSWFVRESENITEMYRRHLLGVPPVEGREVKLFPEIKKRVEIYMGKLNLLKSPYGLRRFYLYGDRLIIY